MDKYCFTVDATSVSLSLAYSEAELSFLTGKIVPEIVAFVRAIGLWQNFKVTAGMNTRTWINKDRLALLTASEALLHQLEHHATLFAHDYWYRLPYAKSRARSMYAVTLASGEQGWLHARHSGQLYLEVEKPHPEIVDLRAHDSFLTTEGTFHVYRKLNALRWTEKLRLLCTFLRENSVVEVSVRHYYVEKTTDT